MTTTEGKRHLDLDGIQMAMNGGVSDRDISRGFMVSRHTLRVLREFENAKVLPPAATTGSAHAPGDVVTLGDQTMVCLASGMRVLAEEPPAIVDMELCHCAEPMPLWCVFPDDVEIRTFNPATGVIEPESDVPF